MLDLIKVGTVSIVMFLIALYFENYLNKKEKR